MEAEDRQSYFSRRARESRTLSEQATDDRVRTVHLELAIRYELLAEDHGQTDALGDEFAGDSD